MATRVCRHILFFRLIFRSLFMGRRCGPMRKKRKPYTLHFVKVGDRADEVVKSLVKNEINKVLRKYGAISTNLDELLNKYINSGE